MQHKVVLNLGRWLSAFRLRTLPLALSGIFTGSLLAAAEGHFRADIFLCSVLTAVLLQILSNLANDYGDFVHGIDGPGRQGPARSVQKGDISAKTMKKALYVCGGLAFLSGSLLLWLSFGTANLGKWLFFLMLGISAIWAAIRYTAGKKPYGYAGLGDIFVLIFFGWIAVLGTFFLHSRFLAWQHLLPATACGLLAVAVLNVNNIRDIRADAAAGKRSIPVRIGRTAARWYHWFLLVTAPALAALWVLINFCAPIQFVFLLTLPLLAHNGFAVSMRTSAAALDPFLKQMALSALLFSLLLAAGYYWAC